MTERVLLTTVPAVRSLPMAAKEMLKPIRLLALAPPELEPDIAEPVADAGRSVSAPASTEKNADEAEQQPVSLHAKLFAFRTKASVKVIMGSANATNRGWGGLNAEATVTFGAGPSIVAGIDALLGSSRPIPAEVLAEPAPSTDDDPAELLDRCRRRLVADWPLSIVRNGECFVVVAQQPPRLGTRGISLEVGLVTGTILPWRHDGLTLGLGEIPLAWQTDLVQMRLSLGEDSCGWMQRVAVTPPIEPGRDRAAIARFLGIRSFYAWMRGLLDGDVGVTDVEPWERHHCDVIGNDRDVFGLDELTLEDILTAWARDKAAFQRADARFETYLRAILAYDETLTADDRKALTALQAIWGAARIALMSAA